MTQKRKIVFATNNADKIKEIAAIIGDNIQIVSLKDIGCLEDIPETSDTIQGNASQKARYVNEKYGVDCFADDTGLEVDALGGAPGVHTARYASADGHDSKANVDLLLKNLEDKDNRKARFLTCIALILDGKEYLFEGVCNGSIARQPSGSGGFGYDPVFIPQGCDITFAMMDSNQKNSLSHRGKATRKLIEKIKSF